jgi:hypothetical protein
MWRWKTRKKRASPSVRILYLLACPGIDVSQLMALTNGLNRRTIVLIRRSLTRLKITLLRPLNVPLFCQRLYKRRQQIQVTLLVFILRLPFLILRHYKQWFPRHFLGHVPMVWTVLYRWVRNQLHSIQVCVGPTALMNWTNRATRPDASVLGRFSPAEVTQIDAAIDSYRNVSHNIYYLGIAFKGGHIET